jgi:hypothetical protein
MAQLLYSIDEAIDRKFIVTKTLNKQAKAGTLVHIMDCSEKSDGVIAVKYRVTSTGQNFSIKFDNIKQFCKWARADNFIARHYENLSTKDILHYIKVSNRTIVSFCVPVLVVVLAIVWIATLILLKGSTAVATAAGLSVLAAIVILIVYKYQKSRVMLKLYGKVSSNNWGIVLK